MTSRELMPVPGFVDPHTSEYVNFIHKYSEQFIHIYQSMYILIYIYVYMCTYSAPTHYGQWIGLDRRVSNTNTRSSMWVGVCLSVLSCSCFQLKLHFTVRIYPATDRFNIVFFFSFSFFFFHFLTSFISLYFPYISLYSDSALKPTLFIINSL